MGIGNEIGKRIWTRKQKDLLLVMAGITEAEATAVFEVCKEKGFFEVEKK